MEENNKKESVSDAVFSAFGVIFMIAVFLGVAYLVIQGLGSVEITNPFKKELTSYEKEYYDDDGNYIIEIRKVIPADDVKEFNDVLDDYSDLIEDINE